MRLLTLAAAGLAALALAAPVQARPFSLLAQAEGNQTVKLTFTNTLDTHFQLYRDGQLIDQVTGSPTFAIEETGQPLGQHTYQAKSGCTALGCADVSNTVTVTVT